jgi:hypothetical protein
MTESQIHSWILLSVPEVGGTLRDIIASAEYINHAIPSHDELQSSLGWLKAKGLVRKVGRRFLLTEAGSFLVSRSRSPGRTMMNSLDVVAQEVQAMNGPPAIPDDITLDETTYAYEAYKRDALAALRKLEGGGL